MKNHTYRTWAEIDLNALKNNIRNIKSHVGENTKVMAIVKADAYGHGAIPTSKALISGGADCLGVAFIDEAEQIRNAGITCPILLLGYTAEEDIKRAVELDITPTVFGISAAEKISQEAKKAGKTVKIHIKIDSGMNRIGFVCNEKSVNEIARISRLENIEIEGIFTHFSCADEADRGYTDSQAKKFISLVKRLEEKGVNIPIKHACNSAGIVVFPEYHFDMVRAGIITYGMSPSEYVDISQLGLKPALTFKSTVSRVQEISPGEKISYGGTFVSEKNMKIATVPIGYADGYLRSLSDKACMLVNGQPAKVVGRICMDQCIIDVTNVNNIKVEDEVVVAGGEKDSPVSFDRLAALAGTINYELFCLIGKRVPRIYIGESF